MEKDENYQQILNGLKNHSSIKQEIYRTTCSVFQQFKAQLKDLAHAMADDFKNIDPSVEIEYVDVSKFECRIRFGGDVLVFTMHTNIFTFPLEHPIFKSNYVKEDRSRSYCGIIHIHNFLSDSLKYNRINDIGYLLGRVFVNKERHFYTEGKSQLGFLFDNLVKEEITDENISQIIKIAINYCFEFELQVPPFNEVDEITLIQKQLEFANSGYQTGKLIGYKFKAQQESQETIM
ncbi:hypothetical protein [Solitalea canadensis]|uniref:Uncharacterized protein n=1 Tax=Solitalea canadensis (strain ATCC 29591 / DSM 3403 / JCM 21819 / LMG 8368 / NBRC 15130 / NCIMB 12057 / USAM 9D) TaxID=929556 RepID=H8KW41_SOLCM|nr:hypothetical protein [Solitalea canadensis]AFD07062.1 hypothetical protein Solca_2007 [Solitalea canadensis DSM 3403]